jgi:pimeloyl-ACP methyl ester carboxylesterase
MPTSPTRNRPHEARPIQLLGRDGIALAADAFGDPSHPPVLLLHGGGQTRFAWGATAAQLAAEGWYAVSMDLRGHGESAWDEAGDYSVNAYVADLHEVVQQLDAKPVLVGASLGGIASLLAEGEHHEELCAAIVLVDIAPKIEGSGALRIIEFMQGAADGFASLEEAADAVAAYLPHRERPRDLSGLAKNLRTLPNGRLRWHWDPRFLLAGHGPKPGQEPDRLRRAAQRLTVPSLLVRGKLSDLLSEEGARDFLDLVPHARFADVSDAGHMVAGDRNDRFSAAVLEFLREVRATS